MVLLFPKSYVTQNISQAFIPNPEKRLNKKRIRKEKKKKSYKSKASQPAKGRSDFEARRPTLTTTL